MGENELKEIQIFVTKHVGTITLFRPQRGNSITPSMGLEIIAILDRWRQVFFLSNLFYYFNFCVMN